MRRVVAVTDLRAFRAYPRDGARVANRDDGGIYRFAGGAPLWISSCDYAPGCGGVVEVDAHAFNVNDHMLPVPADGTLISSQRDGRGRRRTLPQHAGRRLILRRGRVSALPC